jgi:enoyl-CoA hydratase/carnithine racemase
VINRPRKKNAITTPMLRTMIDVIESAVDDPAIRTICLSGAGESFSAGRDVNELGASPTAGGGAPLSHRPGPFLRFLTVLLESPKPTVASIRGFALGGGQATSLACDFVVAERGARFGNVEMAYGFPAAMNIALLSRHIPRRIALEIAMTGELYNAERYYELGLVNRIAEPGNLDDTTAAFLSTLNDREPWAVERTKQTFRLAESATEQGAMYLGDELNQLLGFAGGVHSGDAGVKDALASDLSSD